MAEGSAALAAGVNMTVQDLIDELSSLNVSRDLPVSASVGGCGSDRLGIFIRTAVPKDGEDVEPAGVVIVGTRYCKEEI